MRRFSIIHQKFALALCPRSATTTVEARQHGAKEFLCVIVALLLGASSASLFSSSHIEERPAVILVLGAPGEEEYAAEFGAWASHWEKATETAGSRVILIGGNASETNVLEQLGLALSAEPRQSAAELWVVLLGHGTFDGKQAKFNLQGPDLSNATLSDWLKPFQRPVAVINASSASGPFLSALTARGRILVTATRSGHEQNFARFGRYFSEAITSTAADIDKDGQTSLLEAFLMASHQVEEFYASEGRLATEHALLDDNGDGLGTPADWFRGTRAVKRAKEGAPVDGLRAHQWHLVRSPQEQRLPASLRARRDAIELKIERLRDTKAKLPEPDYYAQLELLLLELAGIYEKVEENQELLR